MKVLCWRWLAVPTLAGVLGALAWAAFTPVQSSSREALFEIPDGTWARRMSGDTVAILPSEIRLTLGVRDVLLLRNLDRGAAGLRPDGHDAGAEFPSALRGRIELPVRLHRARQRADDRDRGSRNRCRPGRALRWRARQLWTAVA